MRPLTALTPERCRSLSGLIFDLDDTLLDHQRLSERAFAALFRAREVGLRLVACTGRPAGWAEVVARQWPIDVAIAENGAVAFVEASAGGDKIRLRRLEAVGEDERARRRRVLEAVVAEVQARFSDLVLADDNPARRTDVTFDIGEYREIPAARVDEVEAFARARGVRTFRSSVHLHLTLETDDKASGTLRVLAQHLGEDPTAARARYAYVGDSENDAIGFSTFAVSVGVDNVRRAVSRLTMPPRYVTPSPMGAGFAELCEHLARCRAAADTLISPPMP